MKLDSLIDSIELTTYRYNAHMDVGRHILFVAGYIGRTHG